MKRCFEAFQTWVLEHADVSWSAVSTDREVFATLYVCMCHGTQVSFPESRACMAVAWQVDRKWIRAAVCFGTIWQWPSCVALTLWRFGETLHPSEMVTLIRRDFVFPSDLNYDNNSLYVKIRDPKTARFAGRQHGRIDDPMILFFAETAFSKLLLDDRLFPGSITTPIAGMECSYGSPWSFLQAELERGHPRSLTGF